jgi:hypothetical protein
LKRTAQSGVSWFVLFAKCNWNDQVKEVKWAGCIIRMEEKSNSYRILMGKLEGKIPMGRPSIGGMVKLR